MYLPNMGHMKKNGTVLMKIITVAYFNENKTCNTSSLNSFWLNEMLQILEFNIDCSIFT